MWVLQNGRIFAVTLFIASSVFGNEDTDFTADEKTALKQFRDTVSDLLYLDYHQDDWYLIHWLRTTNLDLDRARGLLTTSFKWRKQNGIDSVLNDPLMKKFEKAFPHSLEGVDKEGRPILTLHFKQWDIRRTFLAGNGKDLTRYLDYILEKGCKKVRDLANSTQTDITQYIMFVDMNGFDVRQHACLSCLSFYVDLIQHYSNNYPYMVKYVIIFNTNRLFLSLMQSLRPIIPPLMKDALSVYGVNKAEWSQAMLKLVSPDQLPVAFGGTRDSNKI